MPASTPSRVFNNEQSTRLSYALQGHLVKDTVQASVLYIAFFTSCMALRFGGFCHKTRPYAARTCPNRLIETQNGAPRAPSKLSPG
jgi:hypothetical protein